MNAVQQQHRLLQDCIFDDLRSPSKGETPAGRPLLLPPLYVCATMTTWKSYCFAAFATHSARYPMPSGERGPRKRWCYIRGYVSGCKSSSGEPHADSITDKDASGSKTNCSPFGRRTGLGSVGRVEGLRRQEGGTDEDFGYASAAPQDDDRACAAWQGDRAIALAKSILDESHTWWKGLFDFMSTQYTFLVETTYGEQPSVAEKAECWKVVASMVKIIFEQIQEVRVSAMSAYLNPDKARCSSSYLWATMQRKNS